MTHTHATLAKYQDWLNAVKLREPAIWQQAVANFGQQTVDQSFTQWPKQDEKSQP